MGKISSFLTGTKILEEVDSPINGKITVVKNIAFGTYIQVANLTQSGGIIKDIWNKTLKKVQSSKSIVHSCLILGLGGGSVVGVVKKYWPEVKITAVDIDSKMVELGKKYLKLDEEGIKVVIGDAYDLLIKNSKASASSSLKIQNYDLILVDLYIGDRFPAKFEKEEYILQVKKFLNHSGIAVFNRLYYGEKRKEAVKFSEKLEKVFKRIQIFYPEANVMFICS